MEHGLQVPPGLVERLRSARHVVVLTGAGISAESGIPTFREAQTGLWAQYNPADLATPEAFQRNPRLVWEWYAWRREIVGKATPNRGHDALARMESLVPSFTLITQNVDGLHERGGSRNVLELHGSITRTKCFLENTPVEAWPKTECVPPPCPKCGGPLRPDVVWFGESLPEGVFETARRAACDSDLFLSVGTSTVVYPAATLPYEALEHGATVVEVNPQPTALTAMAAFAFQAPSGVVLPELVDAAWPGAPMG